MFNFGIKEKIKKMMGIKSSFVKVYEQNVKGRDFVVGDLHGCVDLFYILLEQIKFDPLIDRVFSVGDLIDRGPNSLEAIELLKKDWFFSVMGNHEYFLLRHIINPNQSKPYDDLWLKGVKSNPLKWKEFCEEWCPVLSKLPAVIMVGEGGKQFNVVHAEIYDDKEMLTDRMIKKWGFFDPKKAYFRTIEGRVIYREYSRNGVVKRLHHPTKMSVTYCGHSIVPYPLRIGKMVYVDTGAFMPYIEEEEEEVCADFGSLSIVDTYKRKIYSINKNSKKIEEIKEPEKLT